MTSPATLTARELYGRLNGAEPPLVLDVRNREEFARWKVEGRGLPELLNIPYFEFIEDEEGSVRRVAEWLGGRPRDLVAVCAEGGSSAYVADLLAARGLAAANLEGGMHAWGRDTLVQPVRAAGTVRIWQILRFGRGCLSYVVASDGDAVVVDPHRGVDEIRDVLGQTGLRLRAVFDTHLHADHVSGAAALARAEGVPYHAHAADFERPALAVEVMEPGVPVRVAGMRVLPVVALHTPGHTPGSTSLLVDDALLLTGDTIFVDGVGRPDLGGQTAEWAAELHRTLHTRLAPLADDVLVLPAHSSGPHELSADGTVAGRLGDVRRELAARAADQATFVRAAETAAGTAPPQYARIRAINLGHATATEDETVELELGKNECALSRR